MLVHRCLWSQAGICGVQALVLGPTFHECHDVGFVVVNGHHPV
jgi:hypothetical protein